MCDPNANVSHFYELMLKSSECLFDNLLEQPVFEEQSGLYLESRSAPVHEDPMA